MELWIRNQIKTKLIKINNLEIKEFEEGYGIVQWLDTSSCNGLGIYKTKERALGVLDEIQQVLLNNEDYDYTGTALVDYDSSNYVYEMPED